MIDVNKPLVSCSVGEFAEALALALTKRQQAPAEKKILRKGLKGICEIFNCKQFVARKILESHKIDEAIIMTGPRSFLIDEQKALTLYNQKS